MSYFEFNVPDTWNGFRDIDDKINLDDVRQKLEELEEEENNLANNANPSNQPNILPNRNIES